MTTYTHIGYRPEVGYLNYGIDAGHYDRRRPGRTHALNGSTNGDYRSLCGKAVEARCISDDGWQITNHVAAAPDATGTGVTCAACRRLLGLTRFAVQCRCPYSGKWRTAAGHEQHATEEAAEAGIVELQRAYPGVLFRVRQV